MNELQLETIKLVPATIEFNKDSILKELNETLEIYENLVFTEENTTDIRKVLAKLRKGKNAADEFRKAKKKEAVEPVTAFENDVKEIVKKFDGVINPINDQLKEFEDKRRDEKRIEILGIISETTASIGLEEKFASRIDVMDEYLAKSFAMNQIKENIEFKANNLLNEQKLELSNKENIETFVTLKNSEHDMQLSVVAYLSQLEFKAVDEVKKTVEQDVQKELDERMRKEVEIQNEKRRKEQEEINREADEQAEKEMESVSNQAFENLPFEPETPVENDVIDDLPFGDTEELEIETISYYRVDATRDEHDKLIKFMENNDIKFTAEMELPF